MASRRKDAEGNSVTPGSESADRFADCETAEDVFERAAQDEGIPLADWLRNAGIVGAAARRRIRRHERRGREDLIG